MPRITHTWANIFCTVSSRLIRKVLRTNLSEPVGEFVFFPGTGKTWYFVKHVTNTFNVKMTIHH